MDNITRQDNDRRVTMRRLIFATAMLAAASAAPAIAGPQSWQEYGPGTGVVRCESNDGRVNRCALPGGGWARDA
jgi:hypothetical protein